MRRGDRMVTIKIENLERFIKDSFLQVGLEDNQAGIAAKHMVFADSQGTDTHGIIRLPIYIERIKKGLIKAKPQLKWEKQTPNSAVLDGDQAIGHYAAHLAMQKATDKAKENTIGIVTVYNGDHFGAAACYSKMAADQGLIGFTTTNTSPLMAPTGGKERVLGNNPFSFAIPRESNYPILLDMATSTVAAGKLILYQQKGEKIPYGWAVDKQGEPTTDPYAGLTGGGSLLPIGGHKGYGLSLIMDILCGVLSGASYGTNVNRLYETNSNKPLGSGYMMVAINIESFISLHDFYARLEDLTSMVVNSPKQSHVDRIYLPGEIEDCVRKERSQNGVPINHQLHQELIQLSKELEMNIQDYEFA